MKGKTWLFWGGLIAAAGGILFQTSYEVQELEEKLASVNRRIVQEQESIQVLKAEWSFLNDPTRLEQLARTHLVLQPVEARQFASLDIIPMRPAPVAAPDAAPKPSFPPTNPASGGVPMVRAPQPGTLPAVAGLAPAGRAPVAKVPDNKAFDKTMIVPASAPAATALPNAIRQQQAPVKPSALVPATAKVPPAPVAPAPTAAPVAAPAGKLPANAPLPALTRPTDIAAAPAKPATGGLPNGVKPTDSLGMLVARLGANR